MVSVYIFIKVNFSIDLLVFETMQNYHYYYGKCPINPLMPKPHVMASLFQFSIVLTFGNVSLHLGFVGVF